LVSLSPHHPHPSPPPHSGGGSLKKILYLISEDSYFYTHRLNLAKMAQKAGFEVAVATRCNRYLELIQQHGINVFPLKHFTRAKINPLHQFLSLLELYRIYKEYQPDIVHHVAMKPVVFGSLIANWFKVPNIINAFGGLGYLFTDSEKPSLKKKMLRLGVGKTLKLLLNKPNTVLLLQNEDDRNTLLNEGCVSKDKIQLIRGSGINLQEFPFTPHPPNSPIIVTCVSRMLWDKGIKELVEASEILRRENSPVEIRLYGAPDFENPTAIPAQQLEAWHKSGVITWFGHCDDIAKVYSECHIAVLPSYREGLPKSLLEAASCGRAIITTDVPGCRSIVQDKVNGYLVPAKNATLLAKAIQTLCNDEALYLQMGQEGRKRIESLFSDTLIHEQMLTLYQGVN